MICPVCQPRQALRVTSLLDNLTARVCPNCGGHWLRSADYRAWRKHLPTNLPTRGAPIEAEAAEPRGLKRCPEDQRVLARMRIGHGVPFTFDFCRGCEGMWFDAGEWSALVERNLHDDLLQMVFDDWQRDVARAERRDSTEDNFRRQLGDEYDRVRPFKQWLDAHPRRSELLAYLTSQPQVHTSASPSSNPEPADVHEDHR